MEIKNIHSWRVTPKEAIEIQLNLKDALIQKKIDPEVELVAGADAAYDKKEGLVYAAVVVVKIKEMEVIDSSWAQDRANFPYVPGLLTFREGPALLEALRKLNTEPDVILFDGQGIAHPRSMGIAAHLGLFIDVPTIGCAKSRLIGDYMQPAEDFGSWSYLKQHEEIIGAVLRSRKAVKPIFVSPGNGIDLESSLAIVFRCCGKYRLPEPLRKAHILCSKKSKNL